MLTASSMGQRVLDGDGRLVRVWAMLFMVSPLICRDRPKSNATATRCLFCCNLSKPLMLRSLHDEIAKCDEVVAMWGNSLQ